MAFTPDESSTGMAPTTAAGLAALFGFVSASVMAFVERKSHFVWLYIHQSLRIVVFMVLGTLLMLFSKGLEFATHGSPLVMVTQVIGALCYFAYTILWLVLTVNAFQGKVVLLPMFGAGLAKKLHLE